MCHVGGSWDSVMSLTCCIARPGPTSRLESVGQEAGFDPYLQMFHVTAAPVHLSKGF